jgi:hypothetical protein
MGRRIFNLLLLVAMLVGAAVTYDMKHKAEVAAAEVARLQAEIAKEKDALALLRAEWSLLTQPGRLQSVVAKYASHFQLEPFSPAQIATIDEIPMKSVSSPDPLGPAIARLAAGDVGKAE